MLTEQQFKSTYGVIYEQEYQKALNYVDQPHLLKDEIVRELKLKDNKKLDSPYLEPFSYRMTRYRGFVNYPDRLKNYIVAEKEQPSEYRSFLPHIIDLEPNAHCNYRCVMCHVSEWDYTYKQAAHDEQRQRETFCHRTNYAVASFSRPCFFQALINIKELTPGLFSWGRE